MLIYTIQLDFSENVRRWRYRKCVSVTFREYSFLGQGVIGCRFGWEDVVIMRPRVYPPEGSCTLQRGTGMGIGMSPCRRGSVIPLQSRLSSRLICCRSSKQRQQGTDGMTVNSSSECFLRETHAVVPCCGRELCFGSTSSPPIRQEATR